jgi:hypothetical protein
MEPVKTQFMQDKNRDQDTAGQPDGQSRQINEGIGFMP